MQNFLWKGEKKMTSLTVEETKCANAPLIYPSRSLLGALLELIKDPLQFFKKVSEMGDLVHVRFGLQWYVFAYHPDFYKKMLVDDFAAYSKQTRGYRVIGWLLGRGLLTSEGAFWRRQRRILQPSFRHDRLAGFAHIMVQAASDLADSWSEIAQEERALDVAKAMNRLTLKVVGITLLSRDISTQSDAIGESLSKLLEFCCVATRRPLWMSLVPTQRNFTAWKARWQLNRVVKKIIIQRRKLPPCDDLLQMLLDSKDPQTGERMSDEQIRDEVMTIFLAGSETTASTLSWCFYLLSFHPEVRKKLRAELDLVCGERTPILSDVSELQYLQCVIKETMRLFPPIWMLPRRAEKDQEWRGHKIKKGTIVYAVPYFVHRDPRFWKTPRRFDPERFLPGRIESIPKFAYLPFSAGQRKCIGDGFAMMEATLILATLFSKFDLSLEMGHRVDLLPVVTLRPKTGLIMRVQERSS